MSSPFEAPAREDGFAVAGAVQHLQRMRPWQRFLGWLFTIGAVLIGLSVLLLAFASLMQGAVAGVVCAVPLYGVIAWVYWSLGSSLRDSADFIGRALVADSDGVQYNLEFSLRSQADFWQLAGIVTAVLLVLYGLLLGLIVFLTVLGTGLNQSF